MNQKNLAQRPATVICLSVVLAFVTTVGISWFFAFFAEIPKYPRQASTFFSKWGEPWMVTPAYRVGVTSLWWYNPRNGSPTFSTLPSEIVVQEVFKKMVAENPKRNFTINHVPEWGTFKSGLPDDFQTSTIGMDLAFGFPFPCVWYQIAGNSIVSSGSTPVYSTGGEVLRGGQYLSGTVSAHSVNIRALPFFPIWPGLVLDILIYTVAWFSLFYILSFIRRRFRKHIGACTNCGYDLSGTFGNICPECGQTKVRTDQVPKS